MGEIHEVNWQMPKIDPEPDFPIGLSDNITTAPPMSRTACIVEFS